MPAQLILKTRTKQPLLATRINWANPITRGLVHASIPGVFRGKSPNLASTNFSTLYGSASPLATSRGVGANISGVASSRVSYQSPVTSGNMTLFCVAKPTATGSACFLGVFNFGNAVAVGNYLSIEAGPVYGAVSTDSANWQIASGRAPVAGETVAIAGSFTASGGRTIYINGVAGNTNATARNPSGLNEINEGCYYGGTGAGYVSPLTGSVVLSLVFNRVLSAAEHKSLTENPWQVFAPETIPLFWAGVTAQSATASIAAAIRADRTASASLNAAIQSAATASATLSGAIQTAQSATSGLTAYIVASSARSSSASLSAAISDARTATSSLSAAVAAARTATAALDSAIQIAATASTGASAAIREAFSLSANLSGAVQASATASASLAAIVATTGAISAGLSAAVRAEQTAFATLSAYIAADVVLTQAEVDMLTDIWRRLGLDIANPLVQGTTTLTFGPTITLSGSGTITSTRTGAPASGPAAGVMLSDVWQRLGLDPANPMTASDTAINAGAVSQTVSESAGTVTVQRA